MSRLNLASESKFSGVYRIFWIAWSLMLFTSVMVVPFMKPLYQNWNITEWLIDYSDGFIRRGLLGSGVNWMRQWSIPPLPFVFGIATIAYISTTFLWIKSIRIHQSKLSKNELLLLLFNPCLILFFVIDGSPLRKDVIPVLFSMISLWMVRSIDHHESRISFKFVLFSFWQAISGLVLSLSHEGISLFLWLPTHVLLYGMVLSNITIQHKGSTYKNPFVKHSLRFLIFSPTLIACFAAIKWSGGTGAALAICRNWESLIMADCTKNVADTAAISALSWNLSQAWTMSGFTLIDNGSVLLWSIPFAFWTIVHLRIAIKILPMPALSTAIKLATWISLTAIPLYLIGWDWGRWFSIQSMLYLSTLFVLADSPWIEDLEKQLDSFFNRLSPMGKILQFSQKATEGLLSNSTRYVQFSSRTVIFSSVIGLPHCCATTLGILAKGLLVGFITSIVRLFTLYPFH